MGRKGIGLLSAFVALAASLLVAHPVAAAAGGPALLHAMAPVRLLDTRNGTGSLGPGATLQIPVAGRGGVPAAGVTAAVLNVTAVGGTAAGYLTLWPSGLKMPPTSDRNRSPGQAVPEPVAGAGGR